MSSATLPPKTFNGVLNSEFNSSDFQVSANDARYLKLTGGTISGALAVNSTTTTNGITSLSGTNQFNTNISLPTTFTASPNTAFPTSSQLGAVLTATQSGLAASTGTVSGFLSLQIPVGVWVVSWRGSIAPTAGGTGTYSNVRFAFSTSNSAIDVTNDTQRVQICASQSATQGATHGYEVALMGSTILQVNALTTYYLNGCSVYTSTGVSTWRGHIHAVRIA